MIEETAGLRASVVGDDHAFGAGERLDELNAFPHSEHERRGGENAGMQTGVGNRRGLDAAIGHRPTGPWVDDVAVTFPTKGEAAKIVAGRRDAPATGERDTARRYARTFRIFQSDVPRRPTRRPTERTDVVAEIHQHV